MNILYSDDYLLAISKPVGMICHPVGHYQGDTLISRLRHLFGEEVRLLHRLDMDTSGVILLARNSQVIPGIAKQFERRTLEKKYLALVPGSFPKKNGTINLPLKKADSLSSAIKIKMVTAKDEVDHLSAVTNYQLLKRTSEYSCLLVTPHTGRKHQIRIHLASLGYPLVGEKIYDHGGLPFLWEYYLRKKSPWANGFPGHGLHALSLTFMHPIKKETITIKAPVPEYWNDYVGDLGV